jgi:putative RecB family exonuclease
VTDLINADPRARTAGGVTWTEPPITGPPRPRRSYSRLDVYLKCPEMYRWKYVEKVPEQPAVWTVGGTAFHTVAEQYLRGQLGPSPTDDELFVAWMEAWRTAYDEVVDHPRFVGNPDMRTWRAANRGTEGASWWEEEGLAMVRRFVRWKQTIGKDLLVFDADGRPALELELNVTLGEVPVITIPDAIVIDEHGQLGIVDYKTGKPPKDPLQLRVYAAAVKEAWDLDVTWGLYYMARPGQLLPRDLTRYEHADVHNLFAGFDERERDGDYRPTPGDSCTFCPYKRDRCTYYNPPEGT